MRGKKNDSRIEVKAEVTEVLDSESDVKYYAGSPRWDFEQKIWREDRLELGRRNNRSAFRDRDEDDQFSPGYYEDSKTKVRVRYTVDGQVYEGEAVLFCSDKQCPAGKRVYLAIDAARPGEILSASLHKSPSIWDDLLFWLVFMGVTFAAILFLLYWCQGL